MNSASDRGDADGYAERSPAITGLLVGVPLSLSLWIGIAVLVAVI